MYKNESCESKVANLLQAACESEVPSEKILLLTKIASLLEREVEALKSKVEALEADPEDVKDYLKYCCNADSCGDPES